MPFRSYPNRVLFIAVSFCLSVLILCGTLAYWLYREQYSAAANLGEDIGSRGAAINLETTLNNLALLHDRLSRDVEPLHEQARFDLQEIDRYANKDEERRLGQLVDRQFKQYLQKWESHEPQSNLSTFLRADVVPAAQNLRIYNGMELGQSEAGHRAAIHRLAWGLLAVVALGSIAGTVLGYGLARSLKRTIHQFLVRVQGASELLEQQVPPLEWSRTGEPLEDGADELMRRVEQVVSKLHQREREVRRAERLAAVGQLAAGVAHEIRNPLTSAILLLETARKDPAAGGLTEEDLDMIESELHRIERSLQTFLDYARPPSLHRKPVDVAVLLRDAVALSRGRIELQHVEMEFQSPEEGCWLDADPDQLRQVALNLILNALDMMPHGGKIRIVAQHLPQMIEFAITDSGPGIRADLLPKLFVPFVTGKETGLGLGLVISKRIVEEHGGTIVGENPVTGGARFLVRLPTKNS